MLLCETVFARFSSRLPKTLFATLGTLGLAAVVLSSSACNYPKPPAAWGGAPEAAPAPPPPPPPPPPTAAAPPPPPPPKCEDLAENCSAGADTKLAVGLAGAWFTPPEGWHYAKTGGGSIAVHPDGTAMMILLPSPDPSDIAPAIEATISERGVTGLKAEKLKKRLKKPQQTLTAAEGTVDLWEVSKGTQGGSLTLGDKGEGTLLVLVGHPAPEQTLIGIGFVVEASAETEAPKIMQAVQTLRGKP